MAGNRVKEWIFAPIGQFIGQFASKILGRGEAKAAQEAAAEVAKADMKAVKRAQTAKALKDAGLDDQTIVAELAKIDVPLWQLQRQQAITAIKSQPLSKADFEREMKLINKDPTMNPPTQPWGPLKKATAAVGTGLGVAGLGTATFGAVGTITDVFGLTGDIGRMSGGAQVGSFLTGWDGKEHTSYVSSAIDRARLKDTPGYNEKILKMGPTAQIEFQIPVKERFDEAGRTQAGPDHQRAAVATAAASAASSAGESKKAIEFNLKAKAIGEAEANQRLQEQLKLLEEQKKAVETARAEVETQQNTLRYQQSLNVPTVTPGLTRN